MKTAVPGIERPRSRQGTLNTARQCVEMHRTDYVYRNAQNVRIFTNEHVLPFPGICGRVARRYSVLIEL